MKHLIVAATLSYLAGSSFAQGYTPYVNPEEQERFDRITAPFLAGEVPPMDPSNYEHASECGKVPEIIEWRRAWRAGEQLKYPGLNHRMNIYHYNQHLNVLETRDCSCAGSFPDAAHTITLFDDLPVSKLSGNKLGSDFYTEEKNPTLERLVEAYCGGDL